MNDKSVDPSAGLSPKANGSRGCNHGNAGAGFVRSPARRTLAMGMTPRARSKSLALVLFGAAVAAGLPVQAHAQVQASPFLGIWHLNPALSKAAPGETLPRDLTTDISRVEPSHVHWSITTVDEKGQRDVRVFDTPGNGEFYSLNPYTMVSHTIGMGSLQSVYRDNTGQTDVLTCTLSNAGRQMTCSGVVTHQDGSVVRYADVFDRQ